MKCLNHWVISTFSVLRAKKFIPANRAKGNLLPMIQIRCSPFFSWIWTCSQILFAIQIERILFWYGIFMFCWSIFNLLFWNGILKFCWSISNLFSTQIAFLFWIVLSSIWSWAGINSLTLFCFFFFGSITCALISKTIASVFFQAARKLFKDQNPYSFSMQGRSCQMATV